VKDEEGLSLLQLQENSSTFPFRSEPTRVNGIAGEVAAILGVQKQSMARRDASNAIVPPYLCTFDDYESLNDYTIINVNGDTKEWQFYSNSAGLAVARVDYNTKMDMDDWLITPPLSLEGGMIYDFSVDIRGITSDFVEKFEIFEGTEPTVEGMTKCLVPLTTIESGTFATYTARVTAPETGLYYIGIHGCSTANMGSIYVDNLSVSAASDGTTPAGVENLSAIPGANAATTVAFSFNAPATSKADVPLTALDRIEIKRAGRLVKTFENPTPGELLTYTDETPRTGTFNYSIIAYNDNGAGDEVTAAVYVGVPYASLPENVRVAEDGHGMVTVSWDPVTTDEYGQPLDAEYITYAIRTLLDDDLSYIADNLTTNSYTYRAVEDGTQDFISLMIYAVTKRGAEDGAVTGMVPVGVPYTLPYTEGFADGDMHSIFGVRNNIDGLSAWAIFADDNLSIGAADGDGGYLGTKASDVGAKAHLFTGKIDLSGVDRPYFRFYTYYTADISIGPDTNGIIISARRPTDPDWTEVVNSDVHTLCGSPTTYAGLWYPVVVDLSDFKDGEVQLRITTVASPYTYTLFDAFEINGQLQHDLVAGDITAPAEVTPDQQFSVNVEVSNDGFETAENYTVELYHNGVLDSTLDGVAIGAYQSTTFSFPQKLNVTDVDTHTYYAVVNYPDEMRSENNQSESIDVRLTANTLEKPLDLTAEETEEHVVKLTWTAPEAKTVAKVTESFEDGEFGDQKYSGWTFIDQDGYWVGGIQEIDIPNIEPAVTKASFFIYDATDDKYIYAHSGNKLLASMYRADYGAVDDWAITPELSGNEQNISLFACSLSSDYPEAIDVLYSTTDTDPESFTKIRSYVNIPEEWVRYMVTVPEGAKYFAIRSTATGGFMLMIDDVAYEPAHYGMTLTPLAYNVYRDGVKLNDSPITATEYIDTLPGDGKYSYYVSTIYEIGESMAAGPVSITSSVGAIDANKLGVSVDNRVISVSNTNGARVELLSLDGKRLYAGEGDARIRVASGVYMVRVGKAVAKVIVK
jgi:hypothetical protein